MKAVFPPFEPPLLLLLLLFCRRRSSAEYNGRCIVESTLRNLDRTLDQIFMLDHEGVLEGAA